MGIAVQSNLIGQLSPPVSGSSDPDEDACPYGSHTLDIDDEAGLIDRAKSGDVESYNCLVLRYQSRIYSIAYFMLGDPDAAADAAQDTFVAAFQALSRFKGGSFGGWLISIVKNRCYDEFRRRKRHPMMALDALDATHVGRESLYAFGQNESPERHSERFELQRMLREGLQELPEIQRLVVVLADVEGYPYGEIAEIMGIPLGTVKSRLSRGRQQMQHYLRRVR